MGVDLNERHLRMARSSAAADGVRIEFVKNDMLTLNVPQKFDACEQYNRMTNRIDGAWAIERNGKTAEKLYSVRVYEVEEFIAMCSEAGFKSCRAYGSWEGDAYESSSSEEIILWRKPNSRTSRASSPERDLKLARLVQTFLDSDVS